jgi:hypothetical protein
MHVPPVCTQDPEKDPITISLLYVIFHDLMVSQGDSFTAAPELPFK